MVYLEFRDMFSSSGSVIMEFENEYIACTEANRLAGSDERTVRDLVRAFKTGTVVNIYGSYGQASVRETHQSPAPIFS